MIARADEQSAKIAEIEAGKHERSAKIAEIEAENLEQRSRAQNAQQENQVEANRKCVPGPVPAAANLPCDDSTSRWEGKRLDPRYQRTERSSSRYLATLGTGQPGLRTKS
jgi:hypothetical protein